MKLKDTSKERKHYRQRTNVDAPFGTTYSWDGSTELTTERLFVKQDNALQHLYPDT